MRKNLLHDAMSGCGDYVEIYDGRDASAPLLAHVTGVVTDARGAQDSFTSTGRNVFVRFVTDTGNYGLTGKYVAN